MTDFADLLWRLLPGVYRQKDEHGELRRFLQIMASPAAEVEASIAQLYRDLFVDSCHPDLLPLIGDLIGAMVDPTRPPSLERAALAGTLDFYRTRGLAEPLARAVEELSGWVAAPVDYSQVVARLPYIDALQPGTPMVRTFDFREPSSVDALGRSDDAAAYTLDVRGAAAPTDRIGRAHFDNHGFFLTVGRTIANQRPNLVFDGRPFSVFTFDASHLEGGSRGHALQLLDGLDGSPLTRLELHGNEAAFFDAPRGFTIRDLSAPLRDLPLARRVKYRAANLATFGDPRRADDDTQRLLQENDEVAVDPELGRFRLNLTALGLQAQRLRVGYLLAPAVRATAALPLLLGDAAEVPMPTTYTFASDGAVNPLRDALDGTLLSVKRQLGTPLEELHDSDRGWRIVHNGRPLRATPELRDLPDASAAVEAGRVVLDLDRGRFALPQGLIELGDQLSVDFSAEDTEATRRTFASLAQRLLHMVPAGVTSVLIDTRRTRVNPQVLI